MNFFEHQALARRNSRVMVLLFLLSVAAIVLAVDLVAAGVYAVWTGSDLPAGAPQPPVPRSVYIAGAAATLSVILAVSLFNVIRLAGGGAKIAEMMGGRHVPSNTADPLERRLRNIVEEMAIASGVRMPAVYVLDGEKGINAFAAGWSVSGAVVAVTRGALETLTRDELQGVIGHEFSHILNGDMGLNIKMIGVLAGIVALGSIGQFAMRLAAEADDLRAAAPAFLVGLALFLIGYIGLFFARLIKAAVSRQREFLADASSVQFTRNPDGMAGALDQIRRQGASLIQGRYAEEMSHMFFGESVHVRLASLFDTHPPIEERIRRVHPGFQPTSYRQRRSPAPAPGEAPAQAAAFAGEDATAVPPSGRRQVDNGRAWGRSAGESVQLVGTLQPGKVDAAARMLAAMPDGMREMVREPEGASAAIVALLLAPKPEVMREQLAALKSAGLESLATDAAAAAPLARALRPGTHLPVIDLALPALKSAPEAAKQALFAALEAVIYADRRVSLRELVILTLVREQLSPRRKPEKQTLRLKDLAPQATTLLALVCHAGTRVDAAGTRAEALQAALRAGAEVLGIDAAAAAAAKLDLPAVQAALEALRALAPLQKAVLIKGLFAASTADGTIRVVEAEVMRLVGAVLDCPLPPLLQEVELAA